MTSPSAHLARQAVMEDWAGLTGLVGVATTADELAGLWALAKAARAPVRKREEKCILAEEVRIRTGERPEAMS